MAPKKRRRLTANPTTSQQTHSNSIDQALVTHNGNVEGVQYETSQLCPSIMTASLNEEAPITKTAVVRVASNIPVRRILPLTLSNVTTPVILETKDTKPNHVTAAPPCNGSVRPVLPSTLSNVTTRVISETKDTRPNHAAAAPPWKPSKAEKTLIAGSIIGQQKRYDEAVQQHLNNNPSLQNHPGILAEFEIRFPNKVQFHMFSVHFHCNRESSQASPIILRDTTQVARLTIYLGKNNFIASPLNDRDIVLMIEDRPESAQLLSTLMQDMKNIYGTELIPLQKHMYGNVQNDISLHMFRDILHFTMFVYTLNTKLPQQLPVVIFHINDWRSIQNL